MVIIGADYHPSDRYIALDDTETGGHGERHFPISLMVPNGVSVLRSRAPVVPMHNEEVGLIEGKESGSLLIRQYTSGRSLRSTFLSLRFVPRLDGMRVDDCPNESRKALLEFDATRGVVDFHTATLTTDQPRLSQFPKVLRECGLRDRLVADG